MKTLLQALTLIVIAFYFSGCGHHRDVRPGAKGVHTVTVKSEDEAGGSRDAMAQANHYCDELKKRAAVVDESSKYVGSMDEATYKNMKTASKVAKTVGGSTYGRKQRNIHQEIDDDMNGRSGNTGFGDVAGVGGSVLDDVAGQGYSVTIRFECQ